MQFRASILTAFVVLIIALMARCTYANDVVIGGTMHTTGDLIDNFILRIPQPCRVLVIQIPVPGSSDPVFGVSSSAVRVECTSTLRPTSQTYVRDKYDNVYKVMSFKNVTPGIYTFDATFKSLDIVSDLSEPLPTGSMPVAGISSVPAYTLQTSENAQSNDPEIRQIALSLNGQAFTEAQAAANIGRWMQNNITYCVTPPSTEVDAITTLHTGKAMCEGWSDLFVALARASGIPARLIGGYTLGGRISYPIAANGMSTLISSTTPLAHAWVELWFPGAGWVPYEPQQTSGFVDSHHFPIWAGPDARCNLPLIMWRGESGATSSFSYAEEDRTFGLNDVIDLEYRSGYASTRAPILICRAVGN